jgi:general secretion pathway protein F
LQILFSRGLFVVELSRSRAALSVDWQRARLSEADAAKVIRTLADLVGAGLPVLRAIDAAATLAPERWQADRLIVRRHVLEGSSLSFALSQGRRAIPAIALAVLRAHEQSGDVTGGLGSAATVLETQAAWRRALVGALAYPAVLMTSATVVLTVMARFVLPQLISLLSESGQSPPPSTQALMSFTAYAPPVLLGLIVLGTSAWYLVRVLPEAGRVREIGAYAVLRVPFVGEVVRGRDTARFCGALGASLGAGLPIARAIRESSNVVQNCEIRRRVEAAKALIMEGKSIHSSFALIQPLTPAATAMLGAGERASTLAVMSGRAAAFEASELQKRVQLATRLIEPMLMAIIGGLVGLGALAIMEAIYSLQPGVV